MAKQFDNLFDGMTTFSHLHRSYKKAAKGKRKNPSVAAFEWNLEPNLLALQEDLRSGKWKHGDYESFYIRDPKLRLISAAPFRDRVVHHALCSVLEPIFERTFIGSSYANRIGKGTHLAIKHAQGLARRYPYVLQCDVKEFFPSIDHEVLYQIIERKILDQKILNVVREILHSGEGILSDEYTPYFFPDDDLLSLTRPRGLPIGNLTSQFWANVYLNELDQFVKRELGCKPYLRYVDDFLVFANSKQQLWERRSAIIEFLQGLRLRLHERSSTVYPVKNGIPYLGFQVFPTHLRVKRRNGVMFQRRYKAYREAYARGELNKQQLDERVRGWIAHVQHADTWELRKALLSKPLPIPEKTTHATVPDIHPYLRFAEMAYSSND